LQKLLKESFNRQSFIEQLSKLIPIICHSRFSQKALQQFHVYDIPQVYPEEYFLAVLMYFRNAIWNAFSYNEINSVK